MTIGARLKQVRSKFKLSLQKAAANFDITPQTLSRYEIGQRTPDNEFLESFGKHFNLCGDWLLYGEPPIYKATELEKDVRDVFFELSALLQSKSIQEIDTHKALKVSLEELAEDTPENFILMLGYMLKDVEVRKAMFQFFHLFQKAAADERAEAL